MQEAQRDTISAFEEYMDACMMSDWAAEKKALFDSALPDTALPGPAGQLAAASITAPYSPPQFRTPLPTGMCWPVQSHTLSTEPATVFARGPGRCSRACWERCRA